MSLHRSIAHRRRGFDARLVAAVAGGVLSLTAAPGALAANFSWAGPVSGNWGTLANWLPNGVPQFAGDTATIDATGAAYTVTLNINATLDAFTLNSSDATLSMNGVSMNVAGASNLLAGTTVLQSSSWVGAGLLTNSASLFVQGFSTIANLSNDVGGVMTVRGAPGLNTQLSVTNPFTNKGLMTFTSLVNATANLSVGGTGDFTNAVGGTVEVMAGAGGQRSFNANVINQGAFNVSASLSLDRASGLHSNAGAMSIGAGSSITVNGNSQRFTQSGGTLVVDGELAVNSATFRLQGGAISGAGLVRLTSSRLELGGGGSGTVVTRGSGTMAGSIVSGQTVIVRGEPGFNTSIVTDGAFSNVGTLTFTSLANATANMSVGGSGTLSNFGNLNILAGAGGQRQYDWNLSNQATGTVEVDADTVFAGPSRQHTTAGQFHIATGRTLTVSGNSQTFTVTNGTLDVDGLLDVVGATFHFNGGTITGDGTARVTSGRLIMGNGGSGTIVTRGSGTMAGNIKSGQSVLVRGEPGFNTSIAVDNSFSNAGTLTFTSLANATSNMSVGNGGTLTNNGSMSILAGAGGQRQYDWNLVNSATGTVAIDADAVFAGANRSHSTSGSFSIQGGRSLTINGNGQNFSLLGGTLTLADQALLDASGSTLTLNGGTITGIGTARTTSGRLALGPNATAGTVVVRGTSSMGGSIASGLNVIVRGEPSFNTSVTADNSFTNAGGLTFTSLVNATSNMGISGAGTLTNTGSLSILAGAGGQRQYDWNLVNDAAGTVSIGADAVFAGTGRTHSSSGSFGVADGRSLLINGNGQTFSLLGGTLDIGAGGVVDASGSTLHLNGGSITGAGTARTTSGRLSLGPNATQGTAVVRGTSSMAGNIGVGTRVVVRGEPSFNTSVTADDSFTNSGILQFTSTVFATSNMSISGGGTLSNAGQIDFMTGSGGQRQYDWNFQSSITGNVSVDADVVFSGSSRIHSNSGLFQISPGRSLLINGNGQRFTQAAGSLDVGAGGVLDNSGSTFVFDGGTISGAGTVRVTSGRLVHGAAGTGTVVQRGSGTWAGDVPATTTVIVRGEPSLNTSIAADSAFTNAGTVELTSTVFATSNVNVGGTGVWTNTGRINILPGAGGQRAVSAVMLNSGLIVNEASSSWGVGGANHLNDGGTLRLSGSALTITGATLTNQNEGSVQGNAALNVVGLGATGLRNAGNVDPGVGFESSDAASIGALTIQGNLTQDALGALRVNLAGLGNGSFDVLTVTGAAALAGVVEVGLAPGYLPSIGDSFRVMNYASRSGSFSGVNTLLGNTGVSFEAQYSGTFMTLVVTAIPSPGAAGTLAMLGLAGLRRRR